MKRLVFVLVLVATGLTANSQQNILLRVGAGLTSHYDTHTKNIGTFCVGIGYEYELSQKCSVSSGLLYFAKRWKEPDEVVPARDDDGNFVFDTETGKQVFGKKGVKSYANYLQVPILFNYYIRLSSPHYVSLSAGPYVAVGVSGKTEVYGDTEKQGAQRMYYEHNTFGDEVGAHRFDTGLSFAVGYEYDRHINLGVNADFGLAKVSREGGKNRSFYLSFMYRL